MATKRAESKPRTRRPAVERPAARPSASGGPATRPAEAAAGGSKARTASRVEEGARAPAFALPDHSGEVLRSASLAGAPYVLYFYPKDDTPGCTREACGFRDAGRELSRLGVRVLGVSADSPASHARFREKYSLDFPLLCDASRTLMRAYGAFGKKVLYGKESEGVLRSTFLVDARGVVRRAWRSVKVDGHVEQVLEAIRAL